MCLYLVIVPKDKMAAILTQRDILSVHHFLVALDNCTICSLSLESWDSLCSLVRDLSSLISFKKLIDNQTFFCVCVHIAVIIKSNKVVNINM